MARGGGPVGGIFMRRFLLGALVAAVAAACSATGFAFAQAAMTPEQIQQELGESWQAAAKVAVRGPGKVPLRDQGTFSVPEGSAFVPVVEATRIMRALGNTVGPEFLGLAVGTDEGDRWIASLSYRPEGHVHDGDAKDWQPDELLESLKQGVEADNVDRKARGFPPLELRGWVEPPAYDEVQHRLVWSAAAGDVGSSDEATVNYNTYLLGREGFYSLNFMIGTNEIEVQKPLARKLLEGLSFDVGKRYEDFNASTDKVAAFGLAALVGGAAVKKLGFFAVIAAFVAKFGKIFLIGGAAVAMAVFKLFRRDKSNGTGSA